MAQFDAVLPGRIHRVIYENLAGDSESEIRNLTDYRGLPFEESRLRFHETRQTVRRLGPLVKSLGTVLIEYPPVLEALR